MKAVKCISGIALPLDLEDVDTDQIIPSEYCKRTERTGFGQFLFSQWCEDPAFVMNRTEHAGAAVLISGANFGCGSSREHAAWAIQDAGFGAVIAPSFADIFKNNCAKVGLVAVELGAGTVDILLDTVKADPESKVVVDLESCTVSGPNFSEDFRIDGFTRHRLLNGLDDIHLTLDHQADIETFERSRPSYLPRIT